MFGISYEVVRPQILLTVLNFVGLKRYTVQIIVVHCTLYRYNSYLHLLVDNLGTTGKLEVILFEYLHLHRTFYPLQTPKEQYGVL